LVLTDKVLIRLNATRGVNSFKDIDPNHSAIGCAGCHGGVSQVDAADDTSAYRAAHTGMLRDPSAIGELGCSGSSCHGEIVTRNETSMHSNLWGEKAHVALRNGYESFNDCPAEIQEGYTNDCASCHTTCGQCHISRPNAAGGGFLEQRVGYSHKFLATPSEENVCTACHGSRVGDDWNANQERVPGNVPDVHNEYGLTCLDCHSEDLHGEGPSDAQYTSRYEVSGLPQCIDCHAADRDDNIYHTQHWPNANATDGSDLSCYACHSQQYNNCNTCHAGTWKSEYEPDNSGEYRVYPLFKMGLNPNYGIEDKPHNNSEYVAVRHVPVSPDAFREWGIATMPNYSAKETWKYTSPHNIKRWTDRTYVTEADSGLWVNVNPSAALNGDNGYCFLKCHYSNGTTTLGTMTHVAVNTDVFVTQADLESDVTGEDLSDEIEANQKVLVNDSFPCGACH